MWNWNIIYTERKDGVLPVLIVPLWNWNRDVLVCSYKNKQSINCTVVELKRQQQRMNRSEHLRINCTVVELKLLWRASGFFCCWCINCTVVELKQTFSNRSTFFIIRINCTVVELKQNIDKYVVIDTSTVLIVPLWNWNRLDYTQGNQWDVY